MKLWGGPQLETEPLAVVLLSKDWEVLGLGECPCDRLVRGATSWLALLLFSGREVNVMLLRVGSFPMYTGFAGQGKSEVRGPGRLWSPEAAKKDGGDEGSCDSSSDSYSVDSRY